MDVQFAVDRVNPVTVLARDGNLRWTVDHQKLARFHAVNQSSDMDMDVALGANVITVIGDSPAVAPFFFRFRRLPGSKVPGWVSRRQIRKSLHSDFLFPRESEEAIRLFRICVGQEKYENVCRLLLGDFRKAALAGVQSFGNFDVAGALRLRVRTHRHKKHREHPH